MANGYINGVPLGFNEMNFASRRQEAERIAREHYPGQEQYALRHWDRQIEEQAARKGLEKAITQVRLMLHARGMQDDPGFAKKVLVDFVLAKDLTEV